MTNWLIFCSFIFCLAMMVLGIFVDLSYHLKYKPRLTKHQEKQQYELTYYLKDKAHFKKHPLFKPNPKNQRDFSPFFKKLSPNSEDGLVNKETLKKLLSNPDDWLEKRHLVSPDEKVDRLFSQIHNYNYWSLDHATIEDLNLTASDFVVVSQIYLSNTFYQNPKHVFVSLEQVRNLSKVLLSTEFLNFKLAGLSLLEKEQQLIEFMQRRKIAGLQQWDITPSNEINRFRLFLNQTSEYISFLTPKKIIEKIFFTNDPPSGTCAAVNKRIKPLNWTKLYLSGTFPFEPSFDDSLKVFQQLKDISMSYCKNLKPTEPIKPPMSSHIPFYRRLYALNLLLKME